LSETKELVERILNLVDCASNSALALSYGLVPSDDNDDKVEATMLSSLKVGKEAAFLCDARKNGSYAEYVIVDHRLVSLIPNCVSLAEEAPVPLSGCTAH